MRSNPYLLNALKYATLTVAGMIIVIISAALFRTGSLGSLTGRLVTPQEGGRIPTVRFNAQRATEGFLAPAETHVLFDVPDGTRIPRITFFGGPVIDQTVRYWGYCFTGNEAQNKVAGKRGKELYDGHFFYSLAERKAQTLRPKAADNNLIGILEDSTAPEKKAKASIEEIFYAGPCYVMIDEVSTEQAGFGGGIPAGLDTDDDGLNAGMEEKWETDPNNPDTDRDGLLDGIEVFVAKTIPTDPDTDKDGLPDGCEDTNRNGIVDPRETSPLAPDSDRDDLCDGNGDGAGCPEPKKPQCYLNQDGNRECVSRAVQPAGEDMNLNCALDEDETDPTNPTTFGMPDYDYKWNQFVSKYRVRPSGQGVDAPEFPIPGLPIDLNDNVK